MADGVESRGQVERDDHVPFFDREILDRRDILHARIVHEDVDAAHVLVGALEHRFDFVGLGQVGTIIGGLAAVQHLQRRAFGFDRRLFAEAVDDDVRALGGERLGNAEADARRRSGDESRLALQSHK